MRVKSLLSTRYPAVSRDHLLTHVRSLMRDLGLRMIPVVDEGRVIGVVTRENILTITSTKSNTLVRDVMESPKIVFSLDEDLWATLKVMLELDEWYVPVVSHSGRYEGVLEIDSFIRSALLEFSETRRLGLAREYMSANVEYFTPEDPITKLWRKMIKTKYAGFPVVRSEKDLKVVGIITQHDLLKKGYTRIELESESGPRSPAKVREAMTSPALTLKESSDLFSAAELMVRNNVGRVPIVNDKGILAGIIDRSDVCRAYLKLKSR